MQWRLSEVTVYYAVALEALKAWSLCVGLCDREWYTTQSNDVRKEEKFLSAVCRCLRVLS